MVRRRSRNVVADETAEANRSGKPGGYTFHSPLSEGYEGIAFTVACVRLGDHAHLDVQTGRAIPQGAFGRDGYFRQPRVTRGQAGRLVLRWEEWLLLRRLLDSSTFVHVAEVENPTVGQLKHHAG